MFTKVSLPAPFYHICGINDSFTIGHIDYMLIPSKNGH